MATFLEETLASSIAPPLPAITANSSNHIQLQLSKSQVDACRFTSWFSSFDRNAATGKKSVTIKSRVVPLSSEFVEFLGLDGVLLPRAAVDHDALHFDDPRKITSNMSDDGFEEVTQSDDDSEPEEEEEEPPIFAHLEESIGEALKELGGNVFVKLDWSAPQDAAWVKGSLSCTNPGDVFLLLKSSDFIQHDLEHAFDLCYDNDNHISSSVSDSQSITTDLASSASVSVSVSPKPQFSLVMRKWSNLHESLEFRCIVAQGQLVAICQRHCRTVFPGLQDELALVLADKPKNMCELISNFFDSRVKHAYDQDNYTFDVYVDTKRRVWLIDFGVLPQIIEETPDSPASIITEEAEIERRNSLSQELLKTPPSHLFSWERLAEELEGKTVSESTIDQEVGELESSPLFLVVENEKEIEGNVLSMHKVPMELVTGELTANFVAESLAKLDLTQS